MQVLAEKLYHTFSFKISKGGFSAKKLVVDAETFFVKRKRDRAISPNHEMVIWERVQGQESQLDEKEMDQSKHGVNRVSSTLKGGRFQGRVQAKKNFAEGRRKQERVSERSLLGRIWTSSW